MILSRGLTSVFRPLAVVLTGALLLPTTPTSYGDTASDTAASCQEDKAGIDGADDSGMVSTPSPDATRAGCEVLADGGTAADALIAAQYVLGLTEPNFSGPGGGGLAIYHDTNSGTTESFDGTVYAPDDDSRFQDSSTGVPQTDRLMDSLRQRFGTRSLSDLTDPAATLATEGFTVSGRLAGAMKLRPELFDELPASGDTMTNTEYAAHLKGLTGTDDPIDGEEPQCVGYRDHQVCGSHSSATGMMIVGEALGILDRKDLGTLTPQDGPNGPVAPATAQHQITEAERVAFADGNTWMADPGQNEERAKEYIDSIVTDADYLDQKAADIKDGATLDKPVPGELGDYPHRYRDSREQGTSQITVRDSEGSMASLTSTLQHSFGSGVKENGYYLNNSLENFTASAKPDEPNVRQAGVRPRTTMSPLLVFDGGDEPVMSLGTPGGRNIPSYTVKTVVGMVDWGLSPEEAVNMPHFGASNRGTVYSVAQSGAQNSARRKLGTWGHVLTPGVFNSGLSVIRVDDSDVEGAADPRRHGLVAAVDGE